MRELLNGKDDIPYMKWIFYKSHVPNHQPAGILCIVYTMNLILPWINRIQLMTCVGIGFHGKFYPFFLVAIDFSKM
jgi:hypothetical protein